MTSFHNSDIFIPGLELQEKKSEFWVKKLQLPFKMAETNFYRSLISNVEFPLNWKNKTKKP